MTKSFSNFTSSNKPKKKSVKTDSDSVECKLIENADKIMDDLSMEDFQKVLEQVTDYSLPESKKSPLVQQLNQQYAKEDNCLEAAMFDQPKAEFHCSSNSLTKTKKAATDLADAPVAHNESHLQKLEHFCETFDSSCTSVNSSLTSSILNNVNSWESTGLTNGTLNATESSFSLNPASLSASSSESSQQQYSTIHNHTHQLPDNSKCCDNLNCESCRQRSRLLFNVSDNVSKIEMKDYSKKAQIVEYSSSLNLNNSSIDHQSNHLKIDFVNTQFAENCLNELNDTNRNYSTDCLNRYQTNLDDKQSHKTLLSSTSDGHISNTYFDNDNRSSNYHLNSNYLKKGSTSSSNQTNGKSEINSYLKKRKKPEKAKLTQDCEGYVGYKDIQFLTNYITGNDCTESMRDTTTINSSAKEMNVKKKEMNGRKKNGNTLTGKESLINNNEPNNNVNSNQQSLPSTTLNDLTNQAIDDLANDKNNNNLPSSNHNIIPNSSTNHQSSIQRESTDLSISSKLVSASNVASSNENNMNNMNNQIGNHRPAGKQQVETNKKNDRTKITSTSRKSSANLELNNQRAKDDKQQQSPISKNNANTTSNPMKIVSNGLPSDIDSIDCTQSDPEDKESGFKIVKYKQLRRRKQKAKNASESSYAEPSSQTSTANKSQVNHDLIKQNKKGQQKNAQNPATARGYESESDYCAVEGRKRGGLRFKCDALLDKKDSISNSDSDSSNEETVNQLNNSTNHTSSLSNQESSPFTTANPASSTTNYNASNSKISYAAIAKMHYSNTTTNGVLNSNNLINNNGNSTTNGSTATTNPEQTHKKDGGKKRNSSNSTSNVDNKPNKSNKSINLTEQRTEVHKTESSNKELPTKSNKEDKKSQESTNSKQTKKQTNNRSNQRTEPTNESPTNEEKFNTAELSNESAISSTSKSTSFNSTTQPPVIMFDLNKNTDQNTQFTFGFFDENAHFQNNLEEQSEQFSSINVDSVNFIIKDSSTVNQQQTESEIEAKNEMQNESDKLNEMKNENTDQSVLNTILNSPINNTVISNSSSSTLNSTISAPMYEGTYIMECEEDNSSSSNAIRDNITKRVQDKPSVIESTIKPSNEITSFYLKKFKEQIPSPIDNHQQQSNRYVKPTRPEFTCNVAYIQAVNYIRRAWDEMLNHSKPIHLGHDGPINWERIISTQQNEPINQVPNVQVCN